ncbi:MAG: UDP-N-acetylmuramoyl-L-alanine--D-glutamate ligase, partial [Acidimicrobiia bacterium]|nr:UDP-N-acetylmuramoyl-L-alanine--D-glutamate ligase [Acidimicrobiia bacterium]
SVGIVDGVVYVNDSKATNPHATMAAAEAYDSVVLLVGGRNKGVDLTPLATLDVKSLIAFGEAAAEIAAASTKTVPVAGTLEEAVGQAAAVAESGDTVLLSPGCASFDEFRSYEERGDAFRSIVAAMGEARP